MLKESLHFIFLPVSNCAVEIELRGSRSRSMAWNPGFLIWTRRQCWQHLQAFAPPWKDKLSSLLNAHAWSRTQKLNVLSSLTNFGELTFPNLLFHVGKNYPRFSRVSTTSPSANAFPNTALSLWRWVWNPALVTVDVLPSRSCFASCSAFSELPGGLAEMQCAGSCPQSFCFQGYQVGQDCISDKFPGTGLLLV